jgi:hypothetical protein
MSESIQTQTVKIVREWVKLDNETKALQKEVNTRKKEKAELSKQLINVMKHTQTECFELKNGVLLYTTKSVKKPITKKVLLDILGKYYDGDYMKASEVNDFILSNREEVVRESIVHKTV